MAQTVYSPAINTYTPLATVALTGNDASITFNNIPTTDSNGNSLRDIVFVLNLKADDGREVKVQFNNDTTSSYYLMGAINEDGFVYSQAEAVTTYLNLNRYITVYNTAHDTIIEGSINDFTATDKHKTVIFKTNRASRGNAMQAGRWANTSAISTIKFYLTSGSLVSGSTLSLYGIAA